MINIIYVGLGGFIGSIFRYSLGMFLSSTNFQQVPFPIVIINVLGAFLIGIFISLGQDRLGTNVYQFVVPGLLGGFTTYSTFAGETYLLLRQQLYLQASAYLLITIIGGILAVAIGHNLGKWILA